MWCALQSAGVDIVNPVLTRCLACLRASWALFTVCRLAVGQCSTRCATSKPLDESTKRPCGHGDYGESPRSGRRFRTFLPREDTVGKRVHSDRWVGNESAWLLSVSTVKYTGCLSSCLIDKNRPKAPPDPPPVCVIRRVSRKFDSRRRELNRRWQWQ